MENRIHSMIAEDRRKISLSGVIDVERFDENIIIMSTSAGRLVIKGKNLSVSGLDTENGELTLSGDADSFTYGDRDIQPGSSFFSRLFR